MNCTLCTFSHFSVVNTASKISFCTSLPERKCTALKASDAMSKTEKKKVLYYWIIHNWLEVTEKNSFLCGFSILFWTDLVFLDENCIMGGIYRPNIHLQALLNTVNNGRYPWSSMCTENGNETTWNSLESWTSFSVRHWSFSVYQLTHQL